MTHRLSVRVGLAVGALAVGMSALASVAAQTAGGGVTVTATYKGKGTVDDTHEIWVFLFDTPQIGQDARPISVQAIKKNGAVASFTGITANPVYIAVAYDAKGDYDGNAGPPPVGAPVAIYTTDPKGGEAAAVKPGAGVKVRITFDDSRRMEGR